MLIGIDASRAFSEQRTGIEEYSYQVIKNLRGKLKNHQVILYVRSDFSGSTAKALALPPLPDNWKVKIIKWPYLWTQLGLFIEMLLHPVDALFVPAHVVPFIRPKNTVVTVHGLEYEIMPQAYSFLARAYMRLSIKKSCRWASKIIAVSENTRKDLMRIYAVPGEKIKVIYEGVGDCHSRVCGNPVSHQSASTLDSRLHGNDKYILFIGRLEERKNIIGIIRAFEILKEQYDIPHQLVLAGRFGYGEKKFCQVMKAGKYAEDIVCAGYIREEEKWALLKNAEVFLFPSFYEGFGLPVLEAQSVGVPVVTSNVSSLPEIGADSVAYCDPAEPVSIADAAYSLINDPERKNDLIEKGYENVKRFSWEKCAQEISDVLVGE